jgi:hypothetical protein
MIIELSDRIRSAALATLPFIDRPAGLVEALTFDDAGKTRILPAWLGGSAAGACETGDFVNMAPDGSVTGLAFVESLQPPSTKRLAAGHFQAEIPLRVVVWYNQKKIDADFFRQHDDVIRETVQAIFAADYNGGILANVKPRLRSVTSNWRNIWNEYRFEEAALQLFTWPYRTFALDLTFRAVYSPNCSDPVEINPETC